MEWPEFELESIIFVLKNRTFAVWEVRREDEFSPLKNGSGSKDTAATARRDLMLQHIRWLQQAGAYLPSDINKHMYVISSIISSDRKLSFRETNGKTCEISPLVSYAGEVTHI